MGFWFWVSVQGLGVMVYSLWFTFRVSIIGFRVKGLGFGN
jgi:hypothetical protein